MKKYYGLHVFVIIFVIAAFACVSGYQVLQAQTDKSNTRPTSTPDPTPAPPATPTPEVIENDDEPLQIEAELVNVRFTAADSSRRFITDLKKEDVRILEDGRPQ